MSDYYVRNTAAMGGSGRAVWAVNTAYSVGDRVVCSTSFNQSKRRFVYECTTGGTSHGATEPTWPTSGTVNDNGVIWTARNPTTWANATIYLWYLLVTYDYAWTWQGDDRCWIESTHDETVAVALDFGRGENSHANTNANPVYFVSTSDLVNEPPTTINAGAALRSTGMMRLFTSCVCIGLTLEAGVGQSGTYDFRVGDAWYQIMRYRMIDCTIKLGSTGSASRLRLGSTATAYITSTLINCDLQFSHASQRVLHLVGFSTILGGAFTGTALTQAFEWPSSFDNNGLLQVIGMDLSLLATNIADLTYFAGSALFSRCKLNASVTPFTGVPRLFGARAVVELSDAAALNYRLVIADIVGAINDDVTYVRTGGASDGTTPIAWKLVSNATSVKPCPLQTPNMATWIDETGSAKTLTVEILHDNATKLKDNDVWLEVLALSTASYPMAVLASDAASIPLAGADQAESTETWYTTGMANPNKQKLSVSVTPQIKGVVTARVCLAKASYTVYVDPKITVS